MMIHATIASGDDGLGALCDAPDPSPAPDEAVVAVEAEWAHVPEILADLRDRRVRGNAVLTVGGGGA